MGISENSRKIMEDKISRIFPDVLPETLTWNRLCLLYLEGGLDTLRSANAEFVESSKKVSDFTNDIHTSTSEV